MAVAETNYSDVRGKWHRTGLVLDRIWHGFGARDQNQILSTVGRHDHCSEGRAWSTHPDLHPGLQGAKTCTLAATPNSHAQWHGSQNTHSSVVTITSSHMHLCASRTQAFLAHPPTVLLPSRAPHTQVLHPSMGSVTQGSTYLGVPHTVLSRGHRRCACT